MSTPKECGLLGRCFYAECHCKPAPVSATEPYDENKAYADLYQEWITWSFEFIDTLNPEIPPSDSYQARTIIEDAFDTLRARVAELERVTEEQVPNDPPSEFVEWLVREMPPRTIISSAEWWAPRIWREARRNMRAALTAARGGG